MGGEHYGQGSSREAAVLSPLHLGVRAVLAKSFARIHRANLINWGIAPLEFDDPAEHGGIERDDVLRLDEPARGLAAGQRRRGGERAAAGARFRVRVRADAARARHPAGGRAPRPDRRRRNSDMIGRAQ